MMLKRLFKGLKIVNIDVFVYAMMEYENFENKSFNFEIQKNKVKNGVKRYSVYKNDILVHQSFLFKKVFLMKVLNQKGPVIGDCYTHPDYRGQSIYPTVLNHIAKDYLTSKSEEILFIIVNKHNIASINGIEKAGYKKWASISSKRWLIWYFEKDIQTFN